MSMQLVATDPMTERTSEMEERTIIVVTDVEPPAHPAAPTALSVDQPAQADAVRGPVPVSGTAPPGAEVAVTASPSSQAPRRPSS